ncbi:UDP-glucose 6-dehydrogenase [Candidatus Falkowbacteria bacterium RIFOXYB2_FULL_35_7]|uniref:UDP-glucose 6-dehydrogenase n=1 Tax=Candidatus Falkowbacteria bacterium RIFOXYC2_FULL_36_12 TaxID=1798002 RepID=A0A1F5T087_9BACT|nr:MAG: UDP-glucose 6-dehydrogenase [Candidatus Falkowbacteria bacterium RIFOXYB2_FULL_35_7]OGF32374.1 MAG: UDP-glucose 6-dehydrogenase [Candidatus Falkowbacteria bacterium RIFOXYC2_FULL_36_12]
MKIVVVGTGYVGLVTGTCLASLGNEVTCVDIDSNKIENLKNGIIPIYEPGLEDLVKRNYEIGRLKYSTSLAQALFGAEIVFIAVGTPPKENGEADLQYVEAVAHEIGKNLNDYIVVVNKSTVPIGTGDLVTRIIKNYYAGEFDVVSNPEFLREGSAINDFMQPDRIVIGCDNNMKAVEIMKNLYLPLNCPILITDLKSAEMIKYASNAFLAMSISFINSVAKICEQVGADVEKVSEGMKLDKRIGKNAFLSAGCGYGGSCFPKDVQALVNIGRQNNVPFTILEEVEKVNCQMKNLLFEKLLNIYNDLYQKRVAIWGIAFKPNTDDIRFAPALTIIENLLNHGVQINIYDPVAQENVRKMYPDLNYFNDPYQALHQVDCLLVITDWHDFKQVDKSKIKELMRGNLIIDGRNIYQPEEMFGLGFNYHSIGRKKI